MVISLASLADMMLPVRKPGAVAGNAATPDNQYPRFDIPGDLRVMQQGSFGDDPPSEPPPPKSSVQV